MADASNGTPASNDAPVAAVEFKGCTIKRLPRDQWVQAATRAVEHNPANAPMSEMLRAADTNGFSRERLAVLTAKYWRTNGVSLTVSFLDNPPVNLRARILSHMNAWGLYANVEFTQVASGGKVRIARTANDGYWSYLGTDILSIPMNQPTMNLDSFSMSTPDSEFFRVVRHETGHTLGFPHEHMRGAIVSHIDRQKAIQFFMATQGWSESEVIAQVLTPLDELKLWGTPEADTQSIMSYFLPSTIMEDGFDVPGGTDINAKDGQFAASIYPKNQGWQLLDNNAATVNLVTANDNLYQLHNTGKIWKYTGTPLTGWQQLDNNPATKKIVAAGSNLYQLHNTGKIWKYTGPPFTGWQKLDENVATVDLTASGNTLYQLHNSGKIWLYTGTPITGWKLLDDNPATQKITASGGNLYQLHKTGKIWKYTGTPMTGWQELDKNPATINIVASGNDLYQLHNTGKIWKYTGTPMTGWQQLDDNPATRSIAAGAGALYQIHKTGEIWKYAAGSWKQLDGNAASASIIAGNSLYQLHQAGHIWRFMG
ncbi:hypothetical protein DV736_g3107, partial [Chaetothyriales sp. CBS 134916]